MRFPEAYFQRLDETPDEDFYNIPRKVVHLDDGALAATSQIYGQLLPPNGRILDLMSSWRSHLPAHYKAKRVTGLGMNAAEMADNPQLDDFVVHNLNVAPQLPFDNAVFDGIICTVSIQYLTRPIAVFSDLYRVLKPNGIAIITFSNRCFPTKAISVWQTASMAQRAALVASYFEAADFDDINAEDRSPKPHHHLFSRASSDPLIAVWGYRPPFDR
ncbi:MAG: class I SAM-dependent methyltransferase [Anaerolineae bacterium]